MSESIQTTLISCNRGNAAVKQDNNTGQFINEIPYGVKVEAGDTISVESISVSTIGTGADVIEIPERITDYNYLTNKVQLETLLYINHNCLYDVMLPLKKGSGGSGGSFSFYNSTADKDSPEGKYGYSTPSGYDVNNNQKFRPTDAKRDINVQLSGKPFYLGSFAPNPRAGAYAGTDTDNSLYPSHQVWNFFSKRIIMEIETGYNSPANISKTITQKLHQSNVTPNYTVLNGLNQVNQPTSDSRYYDDGSDGEKRDFSITDFNGTMEVIHAIPRTYTNGSPGFNFASVYTGTLGSSNPYYHYWGSRLLCSGINPEGTTKHNQFLADAFAGAGVPRDFNIYTLNNRLFNINPLQAGFTLVTNLPYDGTTLVKLQGFLHSQKQLDPSTSLTTDDLFKKENQIKFFTDMRYGRNNDGAGQNIQLPNTLIGISSMGFNRVRTRTFYQESYVGNAFVNSETPGCSIDYDATVTLNGVTYSYKEIAKYLNINVVPVKTQYTPTSPIQINIGIVIDPGTILISQMQTGSDFLVDFSMYNDRANLVMVASTDITPGGNIHHYDDLIQQIFIGAPELSFTFDADQARFKFERLYWSHYITNDSTGDSANASAGNEVITLNAYNQTFYTEDVLIYHYAQAGMGITDISVFDLDGNAQLINWYDDKDIEEKFTQSLLWRLGFRYKNFINKYGIPLALQLEKYYNTRIATTNVNKFSYPLTSNPRFDTTLVPSISTYDNNLPAWTLSLSRGEKDINIASEPNAILATALPKKLATPVWLIESDIIEGINYTIDGKPKNIIAVVNRAYSNSDFVFSFATDYKFTATNPFVITHIKSNILTSDLINAQVDDETSIIYKIEHITKLGENQAVLDEANPYDITIE